jgi:hypothetical protein
VAGGRWSAGAPWVPGVPGPGLEAGVCGTGGSLRPVSGAVAVPLAAAPSGAAARSAEPFADPSGAGLAAGGEPVTVPPVTVPGVAATAAARSSRDGPAASGRGAPPGRAPVIAPSRGADGLGPC